MVGTPSTELPQGGQPSCTFQAPRQGRSCHPEVHKPFLGRMRGPECWDGHHALLLFFGEHATLFMQRHCPAQQEMLGRPGAEEREKGTEPRYPTDGLGLISGCIVVSARGSAMDQVVWQGSLGLLFLPLPFSPSPRSNSPGLSINCRRGSRGF